MQHVTSLKSLSLRDNNITGETTNGLTLAIKSNKLLEKLVGWHWLKNFCGLTLNMTLQVNYTENNQIFEEAGKVCISICIAT